MKALVVYDSAYGNTTSVAEAIARVRMFIHGDAAKTMTHALRAGGADIIAEPG